MLVGPGGGAPLAPRLCFLRPSGAGLRAPLNPRDGRRRKVKTEQDELANSSGVGFSIALPNGGDYADYFAHADRASRFLRSAGSDLEFLHPIGVDIRRCGRRLLLCSDGSDKAR